MATHMPRGRPADTPVQGQPLRKKLKLYALAQQESPSRSSREEKSETSKDVSTSWSMDPKTTAGPMPLRLVSTNTSEPFSSRPKSSSESKLSPRATPRLLTLPQEILDMIFQFAYPPITNLKLKGRFWYEREAELRRHRLQVLQSSEYHWTEEIVDYAEGRGTQVYPGPHIDIFLVSKKFFENASRAYVCYQTFDVYDVLSCIARDEKLRQRNILFQYTRHLTASDTFPGNFEFPALKTLHFTFTGSCHLRAEFGVTAPCYCDADEIQMEDFMRMPVFNAIKKLRGLTKFTVTADGYDRAPALFQKNVRAFEKLLSEYVHQPQQEESRTKQDAPLRRRKQHAMLAQAPPDTKLIAVAKLLQFAAPLTQAPDKKFAEIHEYHHARPQNIDGGTNPPGVPKTILHHDAIAYDFIKIALYGWVVCGAIRLFGEDINLSTAFFSLALGSLIHFLSQFLFLRIRGM